MRAKRAKEINRWAEEKFKGDKKEVEKLVAKKKNDKGIVYDCFQRFNPLKNYKRRLKREWRALPEK